MYKNSTTVIPYDDIDKEIVELCKALNNIDGVETTSSCCGHNEEVCYIWFKVENIKVFNKLLFHCFNHEWFWMIQADTGDPHRNWSDLHFVLTSRDICKQEDFDELAEWINKVSEAIKLTNTEWGISESEDE